MAASRDRIAPNCTIRHPVRPIVALQRRMRFSARLAEFCRDRCHQRRARRAERASFSAFVSNPDFRVPRMRPNRRTGADLAVRPPRRSHPSDPESRPGLSRRSWPSTFWSRCSPGSVASRCWMMFSCAYGEPESPTSPPTRPRTGARHGAMTIETARRASLEFVCIFGHDGAERASFSVFVSNLYFRVPRLRQIEDGR